MITPGRPRLSRVVTGSDPADPCNVIVAQPGLAAGGLLQHAGLRPGSGGRAATAPVGAQVTAPGSAVPALAGATHHR
ncbi:hypothetical protein [Kitasatospora sp. NRRL B-11411]|uniref:hypothetical protein n=1 Tax=Kitasatospora sp. NRRL B-11411 TaxID=1463822 RepID=UPI0004C2B940|nr:hypothetical protein [Kitasatospora sp. NRRL B-11411]